MLPVPPKRTVPKRIALPEKLKLLERGSAVAGADFATAVVEALYGSITRAVDWHASAMVQE